MSIVQIDRGFIRTSDGLIHYRTAGSEKLGHLPLVMLHASPVASGSLEPLMKELASSRRLLAPDTLGNGDSSAPPKQNPEISDYANTTIKFADALGVSEFDLYGTHTGAHIGIEIAIRNPLRVRRLILDGVALLTDSERVEYLANYAPCKQPDEMGSQFHWAWNYLRDMMIFHPHYKKDRDHVRVGGTLSPDILHQFTVELLKNIRTYHLAYHAVFRHNVEERLRLVPVPTGIVKSGGDPLDKHAEWALSIVPTAELLEESPRDLLVTNRTKAGLINEFLS